MLCAYYVTEILLLVYIFSTPATTPIIPSQSHSTSKPHSTYHTENNTHAHPLRITSTAHARTHASFFSSVSTAVETASSLPPSPLAIRVNPNQRSASSPYTYANVPPAVSFNDPRARRVINATVAGSITAARETHTHTHTHTQRERETMPTTHRRRRRRRRRPRMREADYGARCTHSPVPNSVLGFSPWACVVKRSTWSPSVMWS